MTYPKARRVVLGHSPNPSTPREPFFGNVSSSSSRRLDSMFHGWQDQAVGANVWWSAHDREIPDKSHLDEILEETGCEIVIALGNVVGELIGVPTAVPALQWYEVPFKDRTIRVVKLPHPSGLNRFYNDVDNRVRAANAFREALLA